jgi:3-oxoadipate enol-lactonase
MIATADEIKVKLNNITVCYEDHGTGTIPILFVHGFPLNKSIWREQMDELQKHHRVISYDIRGFGGSGSSDAEENMSLYADDLIALLDHLKIDKVIACGISMGGYILLNAIMRYPKRFRALVLSDTQCIADSFTMRDRRFATIANIKQNGTAEFTEDFIKNSLSKSGQSNPELVQRLRKTITEASPDSIIRALNAMRKREEMCFYLNKISVPVLILCGKEDNVTPLAQSEYLYNKLSFATLHCIEGAGHLSNLEQPQQFNDHVTDFIEIIEK